MDYGFQVIGDHGIVQIDQDHLNYALWAKTIVMPVTEHTWEFVTDYRATILAPATNSYVVAISSSDPVAVLSAVSGSVTVSTRERGVIVTIYLFTAIPPGTSEYGLQVFTASGATAYDSNLKYMRVVYSGNTANRNPEPFEDYASMSSLPLGNYAVVSAVSRQYVHYRPLPYADGYVYCTDYYNVTRYGYELRSLPYTGFHIIGGPTDVSVFWSLTGQQVLMIDVTEVW